MKTVLTLILALAAVAPVFADSWPPTLTLDLRLDQTFEVLLPNGRTMTWKAHEIAQVLEATLIQSMRQAQRAQKAEAAKREAEAKELEALRARCTKADARKEAADAKPAKPEPEKEGSSCVPPPVEE